MKVMYWVLGIILGIPTLLFGLMYAASELGGEVVTLDRAEADGSNSQVRIWIVDEGAVSWVEHGAPDSFWITQLSTSPDIVLNRAGQPTSYSGMADPGSHDLYHRLRQQKYGVADEIVVLFGGAADECEGVPVRLQLANM